MTMKPFASAALLLALAGAPVAFAGETKFTDFTVDVPENCTAEEKDGALTVFCRENTFFSLSLRSAGRLKGKEGADELARLHKGAAPMLNDCGNYVFAAERNGVSVTVELIERDDLLLVYMSDNNPDGWPEGLSKAFDSITGNTPVADDFVKKHLLGPPDEQP